MRNNDIVSLLAGGNNMIPRRRNKARRRASYAAMEGDPVPGGTNIIEPIVPKRGGGRHGGGGRAMRGMSSGGDPIKALLRQQGITPGMEVPGLGISQAEMMRRSWGMPGMPGYGASLQGTSPTGYLQGGSTMFSGPAGYQINPNAKPMRGGQGRFPMGGFGVR